LPIVRAVRCHRYGVIDVMTEMLTPAA